VMTPWVGTKTEHWVNKSFVGVVVASVEATGMHNTPAVSCKTQHSAKIAAELDCIASTKWQANYKFNNWQKCLEIMD